MDTLLPDCRLTQQALEERLRRAVASPPAADADHVRDQYADIDTFLASASRHNAAILAVVVPAARDRLEHGTERAREYVEQSRRYEVALNQVKAKLYGSTYAIHRTWDSVWGDVRSEMAETGRLELALAEDLAAEHQDGDPDLSEQLHHAESDAPTRPHPYIPHQGVGGRMARSVARRIDGFWDQAEGRMAPEPLHHHDRRQDGPMTQYLLADPHLPDDDEASEQS